MAKASMTSETWRCQPCQERVSLWSSPSSFLAVSKLSSIAQRKTTPSRRSQPLRDLRSRAGDRRLAAPGPKMTVGVDAEHIALAGTPQGHLNIADAVNAVGCDPAKRHICGERLADHFHGERRFCREGYSVRNMGRRHPDWVVRPGLGQIQRPVDEGMAVARHISAEHADLAVRDLSLIHISEPTRLGMISYAVF